MRVENDKPKNDQPEPKEVKTPQLPFLQRLNNGALDKQFQKILKVFKQLDITIPFLEAVTQMPKYVKCLKDIILNKRKWDDHETISMNEECNVVIRNKLPPRLKDVGSITIPCVVGKLSIDRALYDLGASVTLMPLSLCKKLNIGEPKPMNIFLQQANRSIVYPERILEDVPIKVGEFYVSCDFVILKIEEDLQIPIILVRAFFATIRAIINVKQGKIKLEVGEEIVEFDIFKMAQNPSMVQSCFKVDAV
ncbi:uncharacterized protein LOC107262196 [Ricinus communis]|uniref:uncharacterized protein LOC107262196 n=1 Tax=Ricinus communis TaxID=3988 RepID=UPI000772785F|nr:uncharacterized protein LOC107262196 [Ricinus communis]|eukprot:XP_015582000.1 uncharacterized protein LOC107262196 [Ricinus communis]